MSIFADGCRSFITGRLNAQDYFITVNLHVAKVGRLRYYGVSNLLLFRPDGYNRIHLGSNHGRNNTCKNANRYAYSKRKRKYVP